MSEKTMWLVSGTAGDYSSTAWWPVALFDTKERAEDFAKRAAKENAAWCGWKCCRAKTGECKGDRRSWSPELGRLAATGWGHTPMDCECPERIPCHLDTVCAPHSRFDASYEIDEVRVP